MCKAKGVFIGGSFFSEYEAMLFRDSDGIRMHQATGELFPLFFPVTFVLDDLVLREVLSRGCCGMS